MPNVGSDAAEGWRHRVRERTKYALRAALVILVGFPIIWLAMYFVFRTFGTDHPLNPVVLVWLMIMFGALAVYHFAAMMDRTDRGRVNAHEARRAQRKNFSDEEVASAIELVKTERPDVWERWRQHEINNEGYRDISDDLLNLIRKLGITSNVVQMTDLQFELRRAVRRELGLWAG